MISFALSEEQEIACSAVAEFARSELAPGARAIDEASALSVAALESVWRLGIVQTVADGAEALPEQPTVLNALLLEELAYGDAAVAVALAGPLGFAKAIAEQGSPRQKQDTLPLFAGNSPRLAAIAHLDAGWFQGAGKPTRAEQVAGGYRTRRRQGARFRSPRNAASFWFWPSANARGPPMSSRPTRTA